MSAVRSSTSWWPAEKDNSSPRSHQEKVIDVLTVCWMKNYGNKITQCYSYYCYYYD